MLFPIENEVRQVKFLNGMWKFRREDAMEQGFKENGMKAISLDV